MAHNTGAGRPQMYTTEQIQQIVDDLQEYINNTEDPTIVGFTSTYARYSVNKDYISDHDEFSELRKKAIEKQEAYLLSISKEAPVIRIFRLKQPQHGYKDRQEVEHSGEIKRTVTDEELDAIIERAESRKTS